MASELDAIKQIFRTSFNLRLLVMGIIAMAIILIISLALGLLFGFGITAFALTGGTGGIIIATIIGILILVIGVIGVSGVVYGALLQAAMETLQGKKFEYGPPFKKAMGRWKTLLGVLIVAAIIQSVVLLVTIAPFVPGILGAINNVDYGQLSAEVAALGNNPSNMEVYAVLLAPFSGILVTLLVWFTFYSIILLLLEPFFVLFLPNALFGNRGILDSVRESFRLGKQNYKQNLIIMAPVIIVNMILGLISVVSAEIGIIISIYLVVLYFTAAAKVYQLNQPNMGVGQRGL